MKRFIIILLLLSTVGVVSARQRIRLTLQDGETITINITKAEALAVINAIAINGNYATNKIEGETKERFAIRMLMEYAFGILEKVESKKQGDAGRIQGIIDAKAITDNIIVSEQ